jgi:hypothetical protein
MNTHNKTPLQSYTDALVYDHFGETNQPQPAISATPRRDQYLARLVPLHERLRTALASFPADLIADGLHMDQVWPLTLGRQSQKPRAFEVAAALRQLGWQRVRYYQDSAPSTTLWFPPEVDAAEAKAILKAKAI